MGNLACCVEREGSSGDVEKLKRAWERDREAFSAGPPQHHGPRKRGNPAAKAAARAKFDGARAGNAHGGGNGNGSAQESCAACGKRVFVTDRVADSAGRAFHKTCLRCHVCKTSLQGQPYSREEDGTKLVCSRHAARHEKPRNVVQGTSKMAKKESHRAVCNSAEVAAQKAQVQDTLTMLMTDFVPTCTRCGFGFGKKDEIVVNGMQKSHKQCPSVNDASTVHVSPRVVAHRAEDRLVLAVRVPAASSKSYTFMFCLDEAGREAQLLAPPNSEQVTIALAYFEDPRANTKKVRALPQESGLNPRALAGGVECALRGQDGWSASCSIVPGAETSGHFAKGVALEGTARVDGGESVQLQLVVGEAGQAAITLRVAPSGSGPGASARTLSCAKLAPLPSAEPDKVPRFTVDGTTLVFASWDEAALWHRALSEGKYEAAAKLAAKYDALYIAHLFKKHGGMLLHMQIPLVFSASPLSLASPGPILLDVTPFPLLDDAQ